jgi:hypothetical protein
MNTAQRQIARLTGLVLGGLLAAIFCVAAPAHAWAQSTSASSSDSSDGPVAHGTIATAAPVSYDNKYEFFAGLNYMGFRAGPNLPSSMNMGGGELLGTYWLRNGVGRYAKPNVLGLAVDYRFDAGTTPIMINGFQGLNRTLVFQNMIMGGVQVRGPRNDFFATDLHVLAGNSWGNFSHGTAPHPPDEPGIGLYTDRSAFISAIGGSLDINQSKNFAFRLSPDLMLSRFGSYTATQFAISLGVVYRFDKFHRFKKK